MLCIDEEHFVSLLPLYSSPETLLISNSLPFPGKEIESKPTAQIIKDLERHSWVEGLFVRKNDLDRVKRYTNRDKRYKNDFDAHQFLSWVKSIEENTVLCDMEHKAMGKGVFVPCGKKLPKGTFIPSSGVIKLDPTAEEMATKIHCSALQDLNSLTKTIYGFIDPCRKGGILNFINHAPDENEMAYFDFLHPAIKDKIMTSNLKSTIKFYDGYAIMGLEVIRDIEGGDYGQQLLWSYARSCEYLESDESQVTRTTLQLFDNRNGYSGKTIDSGDFTLRNINIFIDNGKEIKKITSLTRWELMEDSPGFGFILLTDNQGINRGEAKQLFIDKKMLQAYLQKKPRADRIILDVKNQSNSL